MTDTSIPSDALARFWAKVDKRGPGDCWPWNAATHPWGYGVFYVTGGRANTKLVRAHRFSYELVNGPVQPGAIVLHSCDNPRCVNPAHLRTGTAKDNMGDCVARGRQVAPGGENHRDARLTEADVREIRAFRAGCWLRRGEGIMLAERYGVTPDHVRKIRGRRVWRCLE